MESTNQKQHWENVYATKQPQEVSWTQENPETSLQIIKSFLLPKSAKIIDIGGGDSHLVDYLLMEGFENITVLDISANAIQRAKTRLGKLAKKITWIVSDITQFEASENYDIWHDRATFHFLKGAVEISRYVQNAERSIERNGYLIIATFAENGPTKCSGLEIRQYSETSMSITFQKKFTKLKCVEQIHTTPFNTQQKFLFCSFQKAN